MEMELRTIRIDDIKRPKFDVRTEYDKQHAESLAKTIAQTGLLHPIVVRETPEGYELVAGVHRILAYEMLGKEEIPAIVLKDVDDMTAISLRIIENVHRKSLNPFEIARAAKYLIDTFKLSIDAVAGILAISEKTLRNYLDMAEFLTEEEKKKVLSREMKVSDAVAIAKKRKEEQVQLEPCSLCGAETRIDHLMVVKLCPTCLELLKSLKAESQS